MKWQYWIFYNRLSNAEDRESVNDTLDSAGQDGWELVSTVTERDSSYVTFVMKCPAK
jgi:hypothetical protein